LILLDVVLFGQFVHFVESDAKEHVKHE
jgi:hypothetical protein